MKENLVFWSFPWNFGKCDDEYIAPELFLLLMTSLFTFYHFLLSAIIFCRFHLIGGLYPTFTLPYCVSSSFRYLTSYLTSDLTFCYLTLYLTLPYILPYLTLRFAFYLTLPYVLPYLTPFLTLPYLTISLTLHFALPYLTS